MFSLNLDDSDENIDTDESLLTQKPHFTLGDEFLNDDENSDASSMHTKRPCFSLGDNENTDTTNEDSEVHAIIIKTVFSSSEARLAGLAGMLFRACLRALLGQDDPSL
jgi:hypothetical protein